MSNDITTLKQEEVKDLSMKAFAAAMAYLALYIFNQIENKHKENNENASRN